MLSGGSDSCLCLVFPSRKCTFSLEFLSGDLRMHGRFVRLECVKPIMTPLRKTRPVFYFDIRNRHLKNVNFV